MWKDNFFPDLVLSAQKTLELANSAECRDRFLETRNLVPKEKTIAKLRKLRSLRQVDVAFHCVGHGLSRFEISYPSGRTYSIAPAQEVNAEGSSVFLVDWNFVHEQSAMDQVLFRSIYWDQINIAWLFDHHHVFEKSLNIARHFDFYVHTHPTRVDFLNSLLNNCLGLLGCAANQWNFDLLTQNNDKISSVNRSNNLYGGFVRYGFPRDAFIQDCIEKLNNNNLYFISPADVANSPYFSMSREQKLADWTSYKTSLIVPVSHDISTRVFDALISGQIPLISDDILDLNVLIDSEDQVMLPIVYYKAGNVESVREAHARAIELFDRDQSEGALRRSQYAQAKHSLSARLRSLVSMIEARVESLSEEPVV